MKRILLLMFLPLFGFSQVSQEKNTLIDTKKFTGIGLFKIGIDTNMLIKYVNHNVKIFKTCTSVLNLVGLEKSDAVVFIRLKYGIHTVSDIPDVNYNQLSDYELTEYNYAGIKFRNLEFRFYKNKLIRVKISGDDLIEKFMNDKYGSGDIYSLNNRSECLYHAIMPDSYSVHWLNGPIIARFFHGRWYSADCKVSGLDIFEYLSEDSGLESLEGIHATLRPPKSPTSDK